MRKAVRYIVFILSVLILTALMGASKEIFPPGDSFGTIARVILLPVLLIGSWYACRRIEGRKERQ